MVQHRFLYLLVSLVVMMISSPFLGMFRETSGPGLATIVVNISFSLVVITAVVAVSDRRNHVLIAGCLAVPAVLLLVVLLVFEHDSFLIAQNLFALGFLVYSTSLVLKFLFVTQRVTFDTICASVCVYFLLGVMWSIVYSVIDVVHPGSFAFGAMNDETVLQLRFGGEKTASALYFSYVTLTTLGYGDIVPSTMLTRMLTSLEAMSGQIYLAVLVARLVGLQISQKSSE